MNRGHLLLIFLSMAVFGCAGRGFQREAMKKEIGKTPLLGQSPTATSVQSQQLKLAKPFSVAIYFQSSDLELSEPSWDWKQVDKEFVQTVMKELKSQGFISDIYLIEDLKDLQTGSLKVDAVLVLNATAHVDRFTNNWGYSYLLIFPALFIPGSQAETLFMLRASLWDTRTHAQFFETTVESLTSAPYIAAFPKKERDLIPEAKSQALGQLRTSLLEKVQTFSYSDYLVD